ncbi:uncharacterized protein LOC114360330 [Ostrinia furnacalis]|uniref:uncharacterized protein LOC114360330 n=1 Tax=Ostrinia furnacalis TaxID=93504 RepID=UPI00103FF699|nr:uncharacterized protein LOC114360330 [Ostrinia furnacalis]
MNPIVLLAVIVGSSFAAPIEEEDLVRTKKHLGAPCAGAVPYAPVALYLNQGPPPHYREDDHEEDLHARLAYDSSLGYGASSLSLGGYGAGAHGALALSGVAHGPAVGVFPNANIGGCAIPILLSCAPNVVAGHLAESHGYSGYSGYSAPAYRTFEEEERPKMPRVATTSHHKVSEDFPEPHIAPASHHVVSEDFPEPNVTRVASHPSEEKPKV